MTSSAAPQRSPAGARPTVADLLKARRFMERHYLRTPLYLVAALSREYGLEAYVKFENHGPVRSFKARGALYRLSLLSEDERVRGVITASTGNHGQGIALAGSRLSVPTVIVVPEGTPRLKSDNIQLLGAELRIFGHDLAEAENEARSLAANMGMVFIEDGDDPGLMAGAGTIAWEILDQLPEVDAIIIPVGEAI